jgi:hypothetical protein
MKRTLRHCLNTIAGRQGRAARYSSGASGDSELARQLRSLLEGADLDALTDAQRDHLGDILASGLAALQEQHLDEVYQVRAWRRGGPGLDQRDDISARWIDHPSRLVSRRTGEVVYRSEPYSLGEEKLRELVALLDQGWTVGIDASFGSYYPGRTVAVLVSRDAE